MVPLWLLVVRVYSWSHYDIYPNGMGCFVIYFISHIFLLIRDVLNHIVILIMLSRLLMSNVL